MAWFYFDEFGSCRPIKMHLDAAAHPADETALMRINLPGMPRRSRSPRRQHRRVAWWAALL